jgi:cell division protein FtsQ
MLKKRWKSITFWTLVVVYFCVALGFTNTSRDKVICRSLNIRIIDEQKYRFVKEKEVLRLIDNKKKELIGKDLSSINLRDIEKKVYQHVAVKRAEAYTTLDGGLFIEIKQRKPILRVFNAKGDSYYLDEEGGYMPLSENFTAYTLLASGNIKEPFELSRSLSLDNVKDTFSKPCDKIIYDLFSLAKFIDANEFWSSQITQVIVNEKAEFELIPRVGKQIILFGDISEMEYKFRKLKSLYYVFNQKGWNIYSKINLKYHNQIICTKGNKNETTN